MEKLTAAEIASPGPDGTTALMQLFANAARHKDDNSFQFNLELLLGNFTFDKFGPKNVLEASIVFGNKAIFRKFFDMGVTENDSKPLAELATLSEDVDILKHIFKKFPALKESCRKAGANCQTKVMRKQLGLPLFRNEETQLIKMSRLYPKFNEAIEPVIKPLSTDSKFVDIAMHIEPLLKEPFCGLIGAYHKKGEPPSSMPISGWKRFPCSNKHKRYFMIYLEIMLLYVIFRSCNYS